MLPYNYHKFELFLQLPSTPRTLGFWWWQHVLRFDGDDGVWMPHGHHMMIWCDMAFLHLACTLDDDTWPWEALLHPWEAWHHHTCGDMMGHGYFAWFIICRGYLRGRPHLYHELLSFYFIMWTNVWRLHHINEASTQIIFHHHNCSHLWESSLRKVCSTSYSLVESCAHLLR